MHQRLVWNGHVNVRQNILKIDTITDVLFICEENNCLNVTARTNSKSLSLNIPMSPDIHKGGLINQNQTDRIVHSQLVYTHFLYFTTGISSTSLLVFPLLHYWYFLYFTTGISSTSLLVFPLLHYWYFLYFTTGISSTSLLVFPLLHYWYFLYFTTGISSTSLLVFPLLHYWYFLYFTTGIFRIYPSWPSASLMAALIPCVGNV